MGRLKLQRWLALGSLALAGCGRANSSVPAPVQPVRQSSHTVSGRVTYNGEPVRYGFVLAYSKAAVDPITGSTAPPKFAAIDESGRYEISNPIVGPCVLCVATDPDLDPGTLILGGASAPAPGGRPTAGPPAMPMPGAPPMIPGQPPMPPGMPGAAPGIPGGMPPLPPGTPPRPAMPGRPPMPVSPIVERLTAQQKAVLKEIHGKYGNLRESPLGFVVAGNADQTFDIVLKATPATASQPKLKSSVAN